MIRIAMKSLMPMLLVLLLAGCDPNSQLGQWVRGKEGAAGCRTGADLLVDCCAQGVNASSYPVACGRFSEAQVRVDELVYFCEQHEDGFSDDPNEPGFDAVSISEMTCKDLLVLLDEAWSQVTDGDESEVDREDTDGLPDGDVDESTCPEGKTCDDLDACTENDRCHDGVCKGTVKLCPNPEGGCKTASCVNGQCETENIEDHTPCGEQPGGCKKRECLSGTCETVDLADDSECDDGNACTVNDQCSDGACSGTQKDCSYLDAACLVGICEDGQCRPDPARENEACDDLDPCTLSDVCDSGICVGAAMNCSELDGECVIGVCIGGSCQSSNRTDGWDCSDGNVCTIGDHCKDGLCQQFDEIQDCSDGISCTDDLCDSLSGDCSHSLKEGFCRIANACIAASNDKPGSMGCMTCDPEQNTGQWSPREDGHGCDDSNACTLSDRCKGGVCNDPESLKDCSDNLDCTDDPCDTVNGECSHVVKSGFCRIQNQCYADGVSHPDNPDCFVCNAAKNQEDWSPTEGHCRINGTCLASGAVNPDVPDCQYCDPEENETGWTPHEDGHGCNDHDACTLGDRCKAGICDDAEGQVDCSDGKACTRDECNPLSGECSHPILENACLIADACYAQNDPNPTEPGCQRCLPEENTTAWTSWADGHGCDDGNACTLGDRCMGGGCKDAESHVDCSDGKACTDDLCDTSSGLCSHTIHADACLVGGVCYQAGDPNPAQPICGACLPASHQEQWTPVNPGMDCSSNKCFLNDMCSNGECVYTLKDCTSPNPCLEGKCLPSSGSCSYNTETYHGMACSTDNPCKVDGLCNHGVCNETQLPNGTLCDDGYDSTVSESCDAEGSCLGRGLPLPTDATTGLLEVFRPVVSEGVVENLCVTLNITTPNPAALLVHFRSPDGTLLDPALFDHQIADSPLWLQRESAQFAGQERKGAWTLTLDVDDPSVPAMLRAFTVDFAPCPIVDGDAEYEAEAEDEDESEGLR